jgi:hypothetical protein
MKNDQVSTQLESKSKGKVRTLLEIGLSRRS